MSGKFEKEYNKLRDRYKQLPDFKKLDFDFEFSSIKDEDVNERFVSRTVKRRVFDKLHYFNGGLLSVISPQAPSIVISHENKFFTNEDRDKMMDIVRIFMCLDREYLLSDIEFSEKHDVEFILSCLKVWYEHKPTIKKFITIMRDSWSKKDSFKIEDYIG